MDQGLRRPEAAGVYCGFENGVGCDFNRGVTLPLLVAMMETAASGCCSN
jgi:hypothetical protein